MAEIIATVILETIAVKLANTDLDKLPISSVAETIPAKQIEPKITDLVVVKFRNKVKTPSIVQEIPTAVDLLSHGLKYDEVVNMKDVTGLE